MKPAFPLFLFISLLGSITTATSQNCTAVFKGEVTDFHDGKPLMNALIQLIGTDKATASDIDGSFVINGICPGRYEVEISHESCNTRIMSVEISGTTTQPITLEHHLEELKEVVVEGSRDHPVTNSATEQILHTDVIEKFSSASLGDALKEISGVSSLNTGSAIVKPVIQGLHSSRIITMNNGVRLQDQEWGIEHAPNLDLNAAGSLTVVKGAAALQYGGDAIGGVIIADPEKIPVKDTIYGKTLLSGATNGRGGALVSSLTKSYKSGWYWSAQGTLKRFGDGKAPDYSLTNTGYSQQAFSASFGLNKFTYGFDVYYSFYRNEIGILRASHIGSVEDMFHAINSRQPSVIEPFSYDINAPKQDITHHLAKVRFFKRFQNLGKLSLQYDFQQNNRLEYDIRKGDLKGIPAMDMELTTHTLSSDFQFDSRSDYKINTGATFQYQTNFPDPRTRVRRLIPDYDRYTFGIYGAGSYHLTDALTLDAGARYDFTRMDAKKFYFNTRWEQKGYDRDFQDIIIGEEGNQLLTNPVFDFHNISATAGIKYNMDTYGEVLFNYALAGRAPNPSELFSDGLHHSAAAIELGDLRMDQETSHKFSASYARNTGEFQFTVAPYANFVHNFILLEPTGSEQTIRGAFPVWEYKQVNARLLGIDLDASYRFLDHWTFTHKFSYVYGKDITRNRPLIDIPPANTSNRITFSKPEWKNLRLTLRSDYFFRQNEFPNNNFPVRLPENGEYVDRELDISTPPSAYHLLGFDASAGFHFIKHSEITVGLTVDNILNTNYRDYLNRLRFFADDLGRNFKLQIKINY
ncbi:TonB-dependent receptor [Sinomicrobium weinanense]|uniref:TonB-dependent receptor n=1 Tax=Sinomicrobium weinanense TaxID=2842200 RepID=A0A926JTF6_9FLAO|nr:TonB-dependent receptor [Sinomicrobium weinanense]MBC9796881.1 TonB-dependent receptor [Sinomicrobium weinanense]MBU3123868.1 TonB-dependent receptor [Sinomicrobium weinanense]